MLTASVTFDSVVAAGEKHRTQPHVSSNSATTSAPPNEQRHTEPDSRPLPETLTSVPPARGPATGDATCSEQAAAASRALAVSSSSSTVAAALFDIDPKPSHVARLVTRYLLLLLGNAQKR
eukprot:1335509-Prymnesium_polylepis.4